MKRSRWIKWVIVLWFSISLVGCSGYKLQPLPKDATILAFGDSLTVGVGVSSKQSYPSVLNELTGLKVVNAGVAGETTQQGLKRLPKMLARTQPDLVILMTGGNDFLQNISAQQTQRNLAKMIKLSRRFGAQVVLVGIPEKKLFANTAPLYHELSEQYEIPLEDEAVASLITRPSMKSDYVHFNAAGYAALAESIYEVLQSAEALP